MLFMHIPISIFIDGTILEEKIMQIIYIFIKTEFKEDESGKFAISMLTSG